MRVTELARVELLTFTPQFEALPPAQTLIMGDDAVPVRPMGFARVDPRRADHRLEPHMRLPLSTTASTSTAEPSATLPSRRAPLIADRAEFIDVLKHLRRGHVLVRPRAACDSEQGNSVLDGCPVYTALQPLLTFALIAEFANPHGFPAMRYYRMTPAGRHFADRALQAWRERPWLERLAIRLLG